MIASFHHLGCGGGGGEEVQEGTGRLSAVSPFSPPSQPPHRRITTSTANTGSPRTTICLRVPQKISTRALVDYHLSDPLVPPATIQTNRAQLAASDPAGMTDWPDRTLRSSFSPAFRRCHDDLNVANADRVKVLRSRRSLNAEENEFYKLTKTSIPFSGRKNFCFEDWERTDSPPSGSTTGDIPQKCGRLSDCVAVSRSAG